MPRIPRLPFALVPLALLPAVGRAEDSGSNDLSDQILQSNTDLYVDILTAGERIRWDGRGVVDIYNPSGTRVSNNLADDGIYATTVAGTFRIDVEEDQTNGSGWAVTALPAGTSTTGYLGRVFSYTWRFNTGSYGSALSFDGSFYALVPGGQAGKDGVIEFQAEGWSGYIWEIWANSQGVDGANARSVPVTGNTFTPEYPIYLNPPAKAAYSLATPAITATLYGAGDEDCDYAVPGELSGTFSFTSNVEGTYHVVCDVNDDGLFDITSDDDAHLVGAAVIGTNTVSWDGTDNNGNPIPDGDYECKVLLTVGEFHYGARDVETSYPGFRLFMVPAVAATGPQKIGLPMFWNDEEVATGDTNMPNGVVGLPSSGASGKPSGLYADATVANTNARSWGAFFSGGKGNDTFIDTYSYLASALSATLTVRIDDGDGDIDGDGLPDFQEDCDIGTDPTDRDTDDDGLTDDEEELVTGTDPNDADSDDDGIQDGTELGVTFPVDAHTDLGVFVPDTDPTTTTDPLDTDSDDDGLLDGTEDVNHDGYAPATETSASDADTDDDGIQDGTESGLDAPEGSDTNLGVFEPDADGGATTTDPLDDDTDNDGLLDGTEDANGDGATTNSVGGTGTSGSGETSPTNADTDGDGVQDGTESGLGAPEGNDTGPGFVPDGDAGATTTDPLDADTDDGGVKDGPEDLDHDGVIDSGEIDPNDGDDDSMVLDSDEDGLPDGVEDPDHDGIVDPGETDPHDADSDDDGLLDGDEVHGTGPLDPFGPTNPLDPDSDDDGIQDGTEAGVVDGTDDTGEGFVPDADPDTTTDPTDDDSDDDGLLDGTEDANHDGETVNVIGGTDTDGSGETSPNDADTDGDGIQDGTELGLTDPEGDDTSDEFVPDTDPTTTTDPLDVDTDDGGAADGTEDPNGDGDIDEDLGETDPNDPADDIFVLDCDEDGLSDAEEIELGTDICDADTDDDGITDGDEVNGTGPLDDWAPTDPLDPDTDDDGLLDGTEVGVTDEDAHEDTDPDVFIGDDDPSTETDPNNADTDGDSLEDGDEDQNHDGEVDEDETDPLSQDTDLDGFTDDFEIRLGLDPTVPTTGQGGVNCNTSGAAAGTWGGLLLVTLAPLLRRRSRHPR